MEYPLSSINGASFEQHSSQASNADSLGEKLCEIREEEDESNSFTFGGVDGASEDGGGHLGERLHMKMRSIDHGLASKIKDMMLNTLCASEIQTMLDTSATADDMIKPLEPLEAVPPICPSLILPRTEARFMVHLGSLLKLNELKKIDIFGASGRNLKLLHGHVVDIPDGRRCLAISSVACQDEPRICIVTQREESQTLDVFGKAGKFYGLLGSCNGRRAELQWCGGEDRPHRGVLHIEKGSQSDLCMTALTADGRLVGSAGKDMRMLDETIEGGGDGWKLTVKPGIDAVLVVSCMLALIVLCRWSSSTVASMIDNPLSRSCFSRKDCELSRTGDGKLQENPEANSHCFVGTLQGNSDYHTEDVQQELLSEVDAVHCNNGSEGGPLSMSTALASHGADLEHDTSISSNMTRAPCADSDIGRSVASNSNFLAKTKQLADCFASLSTSAPGDATERRQQLWLQLNKLLPGPSLSHECEDDLQGEFASRSVDAHDSQPEYAKESHGKQRLSQGINTDAAGIETKDPNGKIIAPFGVFKHRRALPFRPTERHGAMQQGSRGSMSPRRISAEAARQGRVLPPGPSRASSAGRLASTLPRQNSLERFIACGPRRASPTPQMTASTPRFNLPQTQSTSHSCPRQVLACAPQPPSTSHVLKSLVQAEQIRQRSPPLRPGSSQSSAMVNAFGTKVIGERAPRVVASSSCSHLLSGAV